MMGIKKINAMSLQELLQQLEEARGKYNLAKMKLAASRNKSNCQIYEQEKDSVISLVKNLELTCKSAPKPDKINFLSFQYFEGDLDDWIDLLKQELAI